MTWFSIRRASSLSRLVIVLWLLQALAPVTVEAAPLNLTSTHPGDVASFFMGVDYSLDVDPLTGTLTAIGYPSQFDVNNQNISNGVFNLTMTVLRATGAPVSGSVSITGDTDGTPFYGGLLLEGDITDFGFMDPPVNPSLGEGSIFEFMVHVTGGALHAPYYTTDTAGIIMTIANGSGSPSFAGVFTTPFQNDGFSGFSDTFPTQNPNIPEPSSLLLLGLGLMPLTWQLRRRLHRA